MENLILNEGKIKKHLIVIAHPNKNSLSAAYLDEIVRLSEEAGVEVGVRDLYELGFNPVLSAEDFEGIMSNEIPSDILIEQECIIWADFITFIYPIWWTTMPAMMKGYFDRVLLNGFAYEIVDGMAKGLLVGKKAVVINNMGTPNEVYEATGMDASIRMTQSEGVLKFCGLEVVTQRLFGGAASVPEEIRKSYIAELRDIYAPYLMI